MNRQKFIFSAVNAIAGKSLAPSTESLLAETVLCEIAKTKRESGANATSAGSKVDRK